MQCSIHGVGKIVFLHFGRILLWYGNSTEGLDIVNYLVVLLLRVNSL